MRFAIGRWTAAAAVFATFAMITSPAMAAPKGGRSSFGGFQRSQASNKSLSLRFNSHSTSSQGTFNAYNKNIKVQNLQTFQRYNGSLNNSTKQLSSRSLATSKFQGLPKYSQFSQKLKKLPPIDPGIGNGKHPHHDDHHHHHHHKHYPWGPWVINHGWPVTHYNSHVRYYPVEVPVPVVVESPVAPTIPAGGANLVEGVNLQLVDVRLVDEGDPAKNLGPRYRVVIGNRGNQPAGNFQVMAVAAPSTEFPRDLPSVTVEVDSVPAGQNTRVDFRLPTSALQFKDGPFKILAVIVDSNKLIEETSEDDNAGMMERTKIGAVEQR